jgi:hypothetical protein
MNGLLSDLGRTPGVLAACFFGREGGFSEHKGQKELPREKVERALKVLTQSLDALGEGSKQRAKSFLFNTPSYRLYIQNRPEGTVCALCSAGTDIAAVKESLLSASPPVVTVPPKPAPPPPKSVSPPPVSKPVVAPPVSRPAPSPPPVAVPKPAPPPPPVVDEKPLRASILDEIYTLCEEELGDLAPTIFENQEADSKIREGTLTRERVLKFCLALQKDAGMIIGPKASKAMADRMLDKLK